MDCKRHPGREVDPEFTDDRLCRECGIEAWNVGARWADAHWADVPAVDYLDEKTPDGRLIYPRSRPRELDKRKESE